MELTVTNIEPEHAGRGIVAVSPSTLSSLGASKGDNVLLREGEDRTLAQIYPDDTTEDGVIKMDGNERSVLNVSTKDDITVQSVNIAPASEITLRVKHDLNDNENIKQHIVNKVAGRGVKKGMNMQIPVGIGSLNKKIGVYVASTTPSQTVVVNENTDVFIEQATESDLSSGSGDSSTDRDDGVETPDVTYEDLGGLTDELELVREMIEMPMRHPEMFKQVGIEPPKGVLLKGPPGTGKTLMAKAVANEVDAYFESVKGPEILSSDYGGSEEKLREVFEQATDNSPAIVFIDEIDSIAGKREESVHEATERVVTQLLTLMDGIEDRGQVIVMAATNRADSLDPALRRGGRFDREIEIGVPDKDERLEILEIHTREMPVESGVDLEEFSRNMQGFVGADIGSFVKEAGMAALRRVRGEVDLDRTISAATLNSIRVCQEDFKEALKQVEPSAMREVFADVPEVSWDDVGGLQDTKDRLNETVEWPLKHPGAFDAMGVDPAKGILLYGPPGTGKTMLAKAVANETNTNFISIKGPELMNKYVGESAAGIREVFEKARANAPTVIFFDEIDAIAGERGGHGSGSEAKDNVVTQLLTELDGVEDLEDVVVIAATNRPKLLDDALLRPGRFDRQVHVPVPDVAAREAIFNVHLSNKPISDDVDVEELASVTEQYVGADIEAVCREAAMRSMREAIRERNIDPDNLEGNAEVTMGHMLDAIEEVTPSVDESDRQEYHEIEEEFDKK